MPPIRLEHVVADRVEVVDKCEVDLRMAEVGRCVDDRGTCFDDDAVVLLGRRRAANAGRGSEPHSVGRRWISRSTSAATSNGMGPASTAERRRSMRRRST
jgi:hypothetical protein